MNQYSDRSGARAMRTYAPPDVDVPAYPPALAETVLPPPSDHETQAALIVATTANGIMAAIIITAMMVDGSQAHRAIIAGAVYFLASTVAFAFIITGSLTAIVNHRLSQHTERRRIAAYAELGSMTLEWRMMQEATLGERREPTQATHRLSPLGDSPNYVTPYLEGQQAAVEGLRWAVALYDADGRPDRRKVQADGRLAVRMIGSKRGGGSRESGLWLLRHGVIVRVRAGYALDVLHFPTVETVRRLL